MVVLGFSEGRIEDKLAPIVDGVFNDGAGGGSRWIMANLCFALQALWRTFWRQGTCKRCCPTDGLPPLDNLRQP